MMDNEAQYLADKVAFYEQLDLPSDEDLGSLEEEHRRQCRSFFHPKPALATAASRPAPAYATNTPKRVSSAPGVLSSSKVIKGTPASALQTKLGNLMNRGDSSEKVPDSTRPVIKAIQRSGSMPNKRSAETPSRVIPTAKRRKKDSLNVRPEQEQVFRDLAFYYVPDNDIAPARRIRITKAREYGATWTRSPATATHVVVDRNIKYAEVAGILAKTKGAKLVNEDYPIDCIQFRTILDYTQKKYLLKGHPAVNKEPTPPVQPASSEESTRSLQLKQPQRNPRKWDYMPPEGTPLRSEESSVRVRGTSSQPIEIELGVAQTPPEEVVDREFQDTNERGQARKDKKGDELSEYISMMQEFKDLPLDVEDNDGRSVLDSSEVHLQTDDEAGSDDGNIKPAPKRKRGRPRKDVRWEDNFACNSAGTKDAKAENPNARTIAILQKMADYYDRVNDHWRTTAYRKAITQLKRQETKITTEDEAFRLPMIGQRLAQKIEEIVTTDKLQRLEYAETEPMSESLQLFLGIYGVGNSLARQWIAQGFRTLDDLKKRAKLSPNQLVGVEHYDDLNSRMLRREVEALGAVIKREAAKIDSRVEIIIGGSYRRGSETSGDIDLVVTKPDTESSGDLRPFLDELVHRLEAANFLVARLASSRHATDGGKWHGCCILPKTKGLNDISDYRPIWRRIDFLLVPASEIGAALIYFTGNDIFNRSMRLLASKKKMRLNQRGLYKDVMRGPGRVKMTEGELVEGQGERRIFEILGVTWRKPHERWC